jgi:hypothetical protein
MRPILKGAAVLMLGATVFGGLTACGSGHSEGAAKSTTPIAQRAPIQTDKHAAAVELVKSIATLKGPEVCAEMAQIGEAAEKNAVTGGYHATNPSEETMTADQTWSIFRAELPC